MKLLQKSTGKVFNKSEFIELSFSDYVITSFKHPAGLITLRENGLYLLEGSYAPGATLEHIFNWIAEGQSYTIYSIKNISDNTEFIINE